MSSEAELIIVSTNYFKAIFNFEWLSISLF